MSTQDHQSPTTGSDVVPAHAGTSHAEPPPENPGGLRTAAIVVAVALLVAIVYGLHVRSTSEKQLTIATYAAAIPTVDVMHPVQGIKAGDLALPGNVEAFTDTPIYSRTNGYLKKWYFDIGAHVHKGDLLAVIETPEIDQQLNQSRAELERMQAVANLAGVTSNRWQVLLAKHAVSQQEADQTRSNYIAAQAAVDASRANVHRLEQLQSYERIIAPFDGVITARDTDIGDLITAGSGTGSGSGFGSGTGPSSPRELFHLDATNRLRVYVSIPEVDSDSIHDGDEAILTQDANPNLKISGRIVRNANAINESTRTLRVEVDLNNSKGLLRPGAFVFVHFHLPPLSGSVTIPSNTLLFRTAGLQVGVVRNNHVQLVPITVGQDFGNAVEVTSGLTPVDEVILDPSDSLATGMEVHPKLTPAGGQS
jgi:multidrug efflux pump subunit AcrA (membrane-fusion protein)